MHSRLLTDPMHDPMLQHFRSISSQMNSLDWNVPRLVPSSYYLWWHFWSTGGLQDPLEHRVQIGWMMTWEECHSVQTEWVVALLGFRVQTGLVVSLLGFHVQTGLMVTLSGFRVQAGWMAALLGCHCGQTGRMMTRQWCHGMRTGWMMARLGCHFLLLSPQIGHHLWDFLLADLVQDLHTDLLQHHFLPNDYLTYQLVFHFFGRLVAVEWPLPMGFFVTWLDGSNGIGVASLPSSADTLDWPALDSLTGSVAILPSELLQSSSVVPIEPSDVFLLSPWRIPTKKEIWKVELRCMAIGNPLTFVDPPIFTHVCNHRGVELPPRFLEFCTW